MGPDDTIGIVSILTKLPGHQFDTEAVGIIISVISHHIPELSIISDGWLSESNVIFLLGSAKLLIEPMDVEVT